jgi:hypothetical protein
MAQTGFTPIVTYNTATATTVPSAANLAQGELAVNVTDKKLYTKDSGGNVVLLASNGGDVIGPASSTNLAIPTFSGTGGKTLLNNSGVTITAGVITATGFAGPLTGNASTVTTNANLTGPITSVGNATSIASQTGTGTKFVVDTSPTLVTPVLGVATATSINKMAITAPATSSTLAIADGKTHTVNNSIALSGTDATTMTFPTTSATIARTDAAQTFTGAQTFSNAIIPSQTTGITGTTTNNNASAGYVGEYISSTVVTGSAVTINYGGSGVPVTSISLTAGDWDVTGWVGYHVGAASVVTYLIQGISTSNSSITGETSNVFGGTASTTPQILIPIQRVSIASTTTIYLSSATGGSGTALTAYGTIRARRIR